MAHVVVLNEAKIGAPNDWNLCFQYCRYEYNDNKDIDEDLNEDVNGDVNEDIGDNNNGNGKSNDRNGECDDHYGYRFIWRRPDGSLQAARGQARIPSISDIQYLTGKALAEGWGCHDGCSLAPF